MADAKPRGPGTARESTTMTDFPGMDRIATTIRSR
jgi:hypothetical protein